jgi:hypothetical protein
MKKAILIVLACAAVAPASALAAELPFQTVATGTVAPDSASLRPEAFVSADKAFVYVFAYGGMARTHDYRIGITSITAGPSTFVVRATWGPPPMPFLVHPGEAVPFEFARILRSSIRGKIPSSALLVQVQAGLRPHTRLARLRSLLVNAAAHLRSASLLGRNEFTEWLGGTTWFGTPTWYLSVDGNAACGPYNASTGYYLANDETGHISGCGIP